jgi:hypothetical protein
VVGEERPAEPGVLPQRRPLPPAADGSSWPARPEAETEWPVPTPVTLTWVLEGLRRLR